ncbi:lectin c-type domain-containing protein [Ditylenchus destructor]|uniref:Lectin c-type domain-containing protein n=1 Tax=Ditylenchus destructor TaxID=166010 RepID=A0AAD4MY29_9BILA|nr:lectin c-type domain-containing protein [Ditylenchus destructor]
MFLCHFLFVFVTVGILSDGNVAEIVGYREEVWAKYDDSNPNTLYKVCLHRRDRGGIRAEEKCTASMASLASFHTMDELNFINNLVQQTLSTQYIPLVNIYNSFWSFTNGTSYDFPHDTNNHSLVWAAIGHQSQRYEPNGFKNQDNHAEYCFEFEFRHMVNGDIQRRLNDVVCHKENKMFVCKRGSNNFETAELPSEVVNGEISQQKRMRPTLTTSLATKSPLTKTTVMP